MTFLLSNVVEAYNDLMINKRDPRSDDYLLMSSPFPTLLICLCYIYCVKWLGPRLMKNREPFDLKTTIIVYNVFQVAISVYIVYKGLVHAWLWRYSFRCQPVNYSADDPDELQGVFLCWLYYMCKFTEFLDTVFFVMRKKFDQITHLHVIHHSIMPATVWWGVKFLPSGHGTLFGLINTFVHVIMYTYYLMAAMGPQYQKYLWWKKYLTSIQMIQFVIVFLHSAQLFFIDCDYPKIPAFVMCFWALTFFGLFSNFYIQAYIKRRRLPSPKKECVTTPTESKGFTQMATKAISKVTEACYIGQNGLYLPNGQHKSENIKKQKNKKD